jgi:hypothetical protein
MIEYVMQHGATNFNALNVLLQVGDMLGAMNAADVKPVVCGKWVFIGNNMFECSNCCTPYTKEQLLTWKRYKNDSDFPNCCPNCGSVNSYG